MTKHTHAREKIMKAIATSLFVLLFSCVYAQDDAAPPRKIYIIELQSGENMEICSYMLVNDSYSVTLPNGKKSTIDKKDVLAISPKEQPTAVTPTVDFEKEYDDQCAKSDVLFQTLRERITVAFVKGRSIIVPQFEQRSSGDGSGSRMTVDNSEDINTARVARKRYVDDIILANKMLWKAVKDQGALDYSIYKRRGKYDVIEEPTLPEISLTGSTTPSKVTVGGAVQLNSANDALKEARHHWLLAMTKGGTFNGQYLPTVEDIQYVRDYLKWQAYKSDRRNNKSQ